MCMQYLACVGGKPLPEPITQSTPAYNFHQGAACLLSMGSCWWFNDEGPQPAN